MVRVVGLEDSTENGRSKNVDKFSRLSEQISREESGLEERTSSNEGRKLMNMYGCNNQVVFTYKENLNFIKVFCNSNILEYDSYEEIFLILLDLDIFRFEYGFGRYTLLFLLKKFW
jgi:hypothetical protein